jgi:aminoglycoside 6'-N-acetyltransferase
MGRLGGSASLPLAAPGRLADGACETGAVSVTLHAASVTLRPLRSGEVDQLAAVLARAGVREWWGLRDDPEHEREGLRNGGRAFAIEIDGALAGWLGYNEELDSDSRQASLDIFLGPEYQGRGLGRAALRLAAGWLFDQRGHHRLTIDPACANTRAIHAYEAVGFRPVGVMRRYERGADGDWHDNLLLDLLRDELRADDRPTEEATTPRDAKASMARVARMPEPDHPLRELGRWIEDAREAGLASPASVAFITASVDARPSARTVSLKRLEPDALVFTSALWTRKAHELEENPQVALLFHWPSLGRQCT